MEFVVVAGSGTAVVAAVGIGGKAAGSIADAGKAAVAEPGVSTCSAMDVARNRHHSRVVVARLRASDPCLGSAGVPPPPGPAERQTWPSLVAWSSTDRRSQFLI